MSLGSITPEEVVEIERQHGVKPIDRALDDVQRQMVDSLACPTQDSPMELLRKQHRAELTMKDSLINEAQQARAAMLDALNTAQKSFEEQATGLRQQRSAAQTAQVLAEKREQETRLQFDDLKTRLHAAETSNGFMRGYLARTQEDDAVREELVTVGDPDGEQHLVPKRKPTAFPRPSDYTHPYPPDNYDKHATARERRPPKHWITY